MDRWLAKRSAEGRNRVVYRVLNLAIVLALLLFALRGLLTTG
ncbi:hypothetical protein [Mesorhizobium sp. 10J20-29]